jgi:hypothetical protein
MASLPRYTDRSPGVSTSGFQTTTAVFASRSGTCVPPKSAFQEGARRCPQNQVP